MAIKRILAKILLMNNMSLVDLFDLYDQAFDEVCDELAIKDRPSWQHRWFYRFYQINLVPQYIILAEKVSTYDKFLYKESFEYIRRYHDYPDARKTVENFYSTFTMSFVEWWFLRAKKYFIPENHDIKEIFTFDVKNSYSRDLGLYGAGTVMQVYKSLIDADSGPQYKVLAIPLGQNKAETVKNFKEYLDNSGEHGYTYGINWDSSIHANKLSEKSVRDSYKLLESLVFNKELDLIGVGKLAKISKAALSEKVSLDNDPYHFNNLNSARVGVFIQKKLALNLLYGSSFGIFPSNYDYIENEKSYEDRKNWLTFEKIIHNYLDLNPKWLFNLVRKKLPKPDKMKSQIYKDFKKIA